MDRGDLLGRVRVSPLIPLPLRMQHKLHIEKIDCEGEVENMTHSLLFLEVFCVSFKLNMSPSLSACFISQNYHFQGVRAIKRRVNVNATRIMGA